MDSCCFQGYQLKWEAISCRTHVNIVVLYTHMQMHAETSRRNKDERTQFFRKYISPTLLKGFWVRGSWRPNKDCNILSSQLFWLSQPFIPVLMVYSTGGLGPSLCWDIVLIPASSLQLIWTSCRWCYIIIWRAPTSCERHNSYSIQPLDSQGRPLISSSGCTCYSHRCISSFDSLAGVNM